MSAPQGWKLVPVVPTPGMCAAWPANHHGSGHEAAIYRAMLAAAPAAPAPVAAPVGEVRRRHYGGRSRNIGFDTAELYPGANVHPGTKLYSAPAPAPVPMTDEQWLKLWTGATGQRLKPGIRRNTLLQTLRFAERAYGIGATA